MGHVQNGELSPTSPRPIFGVMPNRPHQSPNSVCAFPSYTLAIVEFDDQGRCYERRQMDALADELKRLEGGDAIIVVFVHGWKHDGRSDDDNLRSFQSVLVALAAEEGPQGVPVLGVFVAWRGLSLFGFGLDNLTFWDRKQAGLRVSMGAPRELFGRLRQFRNERQRQGGVPLLVLIGHSFGGMIVYAALAQSLIEAASTQSGKIVPSFADLILLVNPAFEAVRYLPVHDILRERGQGSFASNQNPVFVSVTAINDWATGLAFPAGMLITRLEEATLGAEEEQCPDQDHGTSTVDAHSRTFGRSTHNLRSDNSRDRRLLAKTAAVRSAQSVLGRERDTQDHRRPQRHLASAIPQFRRSAGEGSHAHRARGPQRCATPLRFPRRT
jgi:pimeloyl-ACP methyl ester carboxylesterase